MIDVKQAVQVANEHAKYLFGAETLKNLKLEEVELADDSPENCYWLVTLGFDEENIQPKFTNELLANLASGKYTRTYKEFKINANTGEFKAVKIRKI
jgi:hypothetical protein